MNIIYINIRNKYNGKYFILFFMVVICIRLDFNKVDFFIRLKIKKNIYIHR